MELSERMSWGDKMRAIRCDHDGLKMAEVKNGHLILRTKHHGETHVKIVALEELAAASQEPRLAPPEMFQESSPEGSAKLYSMARRDSQGRVWARGTPDP